MPRTIYHKLLTHYNYQLYPHYPMLYGNRRQEVIIRQTKGQYYRSAYNQTSAMCIELEATITALDIIIVKLLWRLFALTCSLFEMGYLILLFLIKMVVGLWPCVKIKEILVGYKEIQNLDKFRYMPVISCQCASILAFCNQWWTQLRIHV